MPVRCSRLLLADGVDDTHRRFARVTIATRRKSVQHACSMAGRQGAGRHSPHGGRPGILPRVHAVEDVRSGSPVCVPERSRRESCGSIPAHPRLRERLAQPSRPDWWGARRLYIRISSAPSTRKAFSVPAASQPCRS